MQKIKLIQSFKNKKVLVLGDLILDEYLHGKCTRYAAEANIPVLDVHWKHTRLGAAGNVAANLTALGAHTVLCTVIGNDLPLKEIVQLLKEHNIQDSKIVVEPHRSTQLKTRLSIDDNLVYRIDKGCTNAINSKTEQEIIKWITENIKNFDAIILSDYNKGVMTSNIIQTLEKINSKLEYFIALDGRHYHKYAKVGLTLITPNYTEAAEMVGAENRKDRVKQVSEWGEKLYLSVNSKYCTVTLDKEGASSFHKADFQTHIPTEHVEHPYVCGAGDTFVATQVLALISGAPLRLSLELANKAAKAAIQKKDTAICTEGDLLLEILQNNKKVIKDPYLLKSLLDQQRENKKIVFTNGCFDIFHSGHVSYLRKAKKLGDILIIAINADESVMRLKGKNRPVNNLKDRVAVLEELACVDYIIAFGKEGDDTPNSILEILQPHIYVKGQDYQNKKIREQPVLEQLCCDIQFIPVIPHQSTTKIINRVQINDYLNLQKSS